MPYSQKASVGFTASTPSTGRMTGTTGIEYFVQNSKSRSSCAGTAMMAPVP